MQPQLPRAKLAQHIPTHYYAVPLNAKFALDGARGLRHVPIIRCS
jgi:hypothetical protein